MFNLSAELIWMIYGPALEQIRQLAARMQPPAAGPAEDAGRDGLPVQVVDNVAVIPLMGPMVKYGSWIARDLGMTSTTAVRAALQAAVADQGVDTILLHMDTPGGTVAGLPELGDAIAAANKLKPVVVQVDDMAASAGYYAAAQASAIYAGRLGMVGSIGVRMMLYDYSQEFEQMGIEAIPIDTGEFKSAGAVGTKITDAQRADFQRIVDGYFADFKATVRKGRGMTEKQFSAVADGRMFFAGEAMELGLIDGVQTLEQTLAKLSKPRRGRRTAAARARLNTVSS